MAGQVLTTRPCALNPSPESLCSCRLRIRTLGKAMVQRASSSFRCASSSRKNTSDCRQENQNEQEVNL